MELVAGSGGEPSRLLAALTAAADDDIFTVAVATAEPANAPGPILDSSQGTFPAVEHRRHWAAYHREGR
jgi:hypothetical protein